MKNTQTPKIRKNKKIELVIKRSDEPYDEEEGIKQIAELCWIILEADREYQREKLEKAPQYCFYCKKQITALNDLYTYDDQNCCAKCGKKILKDPNKPKTFCGFPVAKTTTSSEQDV